MSRPLVLVAAGRKPRWMACKTKHILEGDTPNPLCACDDCQFLKSALAGRLDDAAHYLGRILWWHRGLRALVVIDGEP